ncbi:hypothetical protein Pmani_032257 [Petrolisthes manimaculis]|uniref:Uncharacterized protein n=1 Tax=Petrolisthes manimaculis TaxID=1843537 RepID=A0AAE1NU16_9EUCA|nr:hypothetical protein Pmani_032257 [Petrolisthes manimaculis]
MTPRQNRKAEGYGKDRMVGGQSDSRIKHGAGKRGRARRTVTDTRREGQIHRHAGRMNKRVAMSSRREEEPIEIPTEQKGGRP